MFLTNKQSQDILYGKDAGYEIVLDDIIDNSRWSIIHSIVIKNITNGKFFESSYSVVATEQQDESPWEYEKIVEWVEVFAQKKEITVYVPHNTGKDA